LPAVPQRCQKTVSRPGKAGGKLTVQPDLSKKISRKIVFFATPRKHQLIYPSSCGNQARSPYDRWALGKMAVIRLARNSQPAMANHVSDSQK
jgi:hypothetical protein